MKWMFLCLVAANLAYFVYQVQFREPAPGPAPKVYANASPADGVRLLGEQDNESERAREAREVLKNPVQEKPAGPSPATGVQGNDLSETGQVGEADVPVTAGTANEQAAGSDTGGDDSGPSPDPDACWRMGAFTDLTITQNIAERVNALGVKARIRAIDAPTGDYDYRVVIPPLNSMQEAFRRLRELKNQGIDSYVMAQGENAQGISLGLFSTEDAAKRHRKSMQDKGYNAEILPISRVSRAYWLYTGGGTFPEVIMDAVQSADKAVIATESDCLN